MVRLKRVYEPPAADDGVRVLVERLWPRGVSKERGKVDHWLKEIAPSQQLRTWYNHDQTRWQEFRERYWTELDNNSAGIARLKELCKQGVVTFVYAARDQEHNSALALKQYLERL